MIVSVKLSLFRVVSPTISFKSIQQITNILKRKPLIWDNIHANDYDRRRVFLGKFQLIYKFDENLSLLT